MKKLLFIVVAVLFSISTKAQIDAVSILNGDAPTKKPKKFKIVNIGIGVGPYNDMFRNIVAEDLIRRVDGNPTFGSQINLSNYDKATGDAIMSGGNLGFFVELHPYSLAKQGWNFNQKLRIGLSMNMERELMIDYYDNYIPDVYNSEWVGYCLIENEVQLSINYLFSWQKKRGSFYVGPGFNSGATYNNLLIIFSDKVDWNESSAPVKGSVHTRFYANAGASFRVFSRLEIFGEVRPGFGMYFTQGSKTLSHRNISGQFGLKYRVMR